MWNKLEAALWEYTEMFLQQSLYRDCHKSGKSMSSPQWKSLIGKTKMFSSSVGWPIHHYCSWPACWELITFANVLATFISRRSFPLKLPSNQKLFPDTNPTLKESQTGSSQVTTERPFISSLPPAGSFPWENYEHKTDTATEITTNCCYCHLV